jgi:hypothetical protein
METLGLIVAWEIRGESGNLLCYSGWDDLRSPPATSISPGRYTCECIIPPHFLSAGKFTALLDVGIHLRERITRDVELHFQLENVSGLGRRFPGSCWVDLIRPNWEWQVSRIC